MKKLNFGCGSRTAAGWVNIDVYSASPEVRRVNLLKRWPFPDGYFDAAYSSHVLEHFTPSQADHLIAEAYRVLRPGGILRTVVPDLEATCREYLRILDASSLVDARKEYDWITLELLDQLTRSEAFGTMSSYLEWLSQSKDADLRAYVLGRTGRTGAAAAPAKGLMTKFRSISPQKIYNKLFYIYLNAVSHAFPSHIRSQVMILTGLGERHRWMYDRIGLSLLLRKHGFEGMTVHDPGTSSIPNFSADRLDIEDDGTPYKRVSIYVESSKPASG